MFRKNRNFTPYYGIFNIKNLKSLFEIINKTYKNKKYRYTNEELRLAYFHPKFLHCTFKPWL